MKRKLLTLLLLMMMLFAIAPCALAEGDNVTMSLVQPSFNESTIAVGRDFYVIIRLSGDAVENSAEISLEKDGKVYRTVKAGLALDYKTDYELLFAASTDNQTFLMPELLYDKSKPESFAYAWNKCWQHDGYICALISGGEYTGHIENKNEDGTPFEALTEGEYTINASVKTAAGNTVSESYRVTLGSVGHKVLSRFSPAAHLYNVQGDAESNGWRVYIDAFAGYWQPSALFLGQQDNKYFSEIKPEWQYADGLEYTTGTIHMYLYNISSTSASETVENGILQATGAYRDGRVLMYRYDYGEPEFSYIEESGDIRTMQGGFEAIGRGENLVFYRAEITDSSREDNVVNVYEPEKKDVDLFFQDGIDLKVGEWVTFIGLTPPFQNDEKDIVRLDDNSYKAMNKASTIAYVFTKDGSAVITATRSIGLTRQLAENWSSTSIYEFSNAFEITEDMVGTITVSVQAYDNYGEPVEGAEQTFKLNVTKE